MINNETYVEEYPNPFILSRESESDYFDAKLTLTNKTNNYVIYKVYFSEKTTYSANPSIYWIKPTSSNDITVKCLERNIEKNKEVTRKMFIMIFSIEKVINSKEEAREVFNEMKENNAKSQDLYIMMTIDTKLRTTITGSGLGRDSMNMPMKKEIDVNEIEVKDDEINFDDADYGKGIEKIKKINFEYKGKIEVVQKEIGNLEEQLENLYRNKELLMSKQQALKGNNNEGGFTDGGAFGKTNNGVNSKEMKKKKGFSKTMLLLFLLLCFIFGGFICKMTSTMRDKKIIITK